MASTSATCAGGAPCDVTHVGAITMTTLENPTPVVLVTISSRHVGAPDMHVFAVDGSREHACRFGRGALADRQPRLRPCGARRALRVRAGSLRRA